MNTPQEAAAAVAPPTRERGKSWVTKTPGVCGGDACLRNTRITVSGLVEWQRLGLTADEILARIKGLIPEDLVVAWDYAAAHEQEIERSIRENQEA